MTPVPLCPWCGAPLERHTGLMADPVISPYRDGRPVPPKKRLTTFVLCTGCEYGEEVRK